MLNVFIDELERALDQKDICDRYMERIVSIVLKSILFCSDKVKAKETFMAQYNGWPPPSFLVIAPGKACNLLCKGCYASSGQDREKLDWDVFDQIITQAKQKWGTWFFTITGGEPMAYKSQGKDLLDIAEKHRDCFFLMYTNGTLITKEVAARMAQTANITPAISVEGLQDKTDDRRGTGVFNRILTAMANLREVGIPFGISMTATRFNCEEILSDGVLDFYMEERGAKYVWLFQYMPIGRGFTLDLLPTPEQRIWMWKRTHEILGNKRRFIADFWNDGTLSGGCISAGKPGGYLYVDWNGKVMPCVFFPYSPVNVNDVFKRGGTLNEVWAEPFFAAIRDWQAKYTNVGHPQETGNLMRPCPMRDHHAEARQIINLYEPDPEDEAAAEALSDPAYYDGMVNYNRKTAEVFDPVWEEKYLEKTARDKASTA